jgi:hypothetical protein
MEQLVNTSPWQLKYAAVSTVPGLSLGSSSHNMTLNNREILGSSPLYAVHAKVIQDGAQSHPVFDVVLIIQPCNERCFVAW